MFNFRKKVFGKNNKKIIFLLCGWPGKIWHYHLTAKVLNLHGFQSIVYEYDDGVLSSSIKNTINNTTRIKKEVLKEIKILKNKGFQDFSIFGTSYGSIISFMITNESKDISKVIINLTGVDLAEVVWTWNKGKDGLVKKGIMNQNITLQQLKESWHHLSPINNLNNLNNRKILIYLAKKDEVIPYELQKRLFEELIKVNKNVQIEYDFKHNHFISAMFNLLNYKKYIKFLNHSGGK